MTFTVTAAEAIGVPDEVVPVVCVVDVALVYPLLVQYSTYMLTALETSKACEPQLSLTHLRRNESAVC